MTILFLPLAAALVAFLFCALIIRRAHIWGVMDSPNHRSSHTAATPSSGGIGVAVAGVLAGVYLLVAYQPFPYGFIVLGISCFLAGVGLQDDRQPIPARWRLGIQVAMGASLLFVLGGLPEMQRFVDAWFSRTLIYAFLLLVIVWWINLFNFMDGIDGLAGMQAIFMLLAGAMLLVLLRPEVAADPLIIWMLCIAGGTAGLMLLNWQPAKIFMGDVGSVYLAFMLLSFGLLSIRNSMLGVSMGLSMWAILGATFATDATITLITRMLTCEKWYQAHRSHLYQRFSRKLGSHRAVTLIYLIVNLFWLLPLAFLCTHNPQWSVALAVVAYLPLIAVAIRYGAGRPDA